MELVNLVRKCAEDKANSKKIRQIFIDEFIKNKDNFCNLLYVDIPFCKQNADIAYIPVKLVLMKKMLNNI